MGVGTAKSILSFFRETTLMFYRGGKVWHLGKVVDNPAKVWPFSAKKRIFFSQNESLMHETNLILCPISF